jgi:hypothetical protein
MLKMNLTTWKNDVCNNTLTCNEGEVYTIMSEYLKLTLLNKFFPHPWRRNTAKTAKFENELEILEDIFEKLIAYKLIEVPEEISQGADEEIEENWQGIDIDNRSYILDKMISNTPLKELLIALYRKQVPRGKRAKREIKDARNKFTKHILSQLCYYNQ